jgi:hypothetical protein
MEFLADIQAKAGLDFPVGVRINGDDYIEGGWTLDDTLRLAPILEQAGADYLHVSAGVYGSRELTIPFGVRGPGLFCPSGRSRQAGRVDFPWWPWGGSSMPTWPTGSSPKAGRTWWPWDGRLLADPDLPNKARQNRADGGAPVHRVLPGMHPCRAAARTRRVRGQSRCGPRVFVDARGIGVREKATCPGGGRRPGRAGRGPYSRHAGPQGRVDRGGHQVGRVVPAGRPRAGTAGGGRYPGLLRGRAKAPAGCGPVGDGADAPCCWTKSTPEVRSFWPPAVFRIRRSSRGFHQDGHVQSVSWRSWKAVCRRPGDHPGGRAEPP